MNRKDNKIILKRTNEDILTKYTYGDIITYEFLEEILEAKKETLDFAVKMSFLKDMLIDYGYCLSNIIYVGYKILEPREIPQEVMNKHIKQGLKRLDKGLRIMAHTNRELLTSSEKVQFEKFEKTLTKLYEQQNATALEAQAVLNDIKIKELGY